MVVIESDLRPMLAVVSHHGERRLIVKDEGAFASLVDAKAE
jgi:hypothetical protein